MSFKIKSEQTLVNVVPVDSVNGAKPEAEERPLETHSVVENMQPVPVTTFGPKHSTVVQSEVIATAVKRLGKQCGHCANFNVEQGRFMLDEIRKASARGDLQATNFLHTLRAHAIGVKAADPEIYTAQPHGPDVVDHYIAELGLCRAYSEMMQDVMLQHPTETCPSDEGLQEMSDFVHGWPLSAKDQLIGLKASEVLAHASRPKPFGIMYSPKDSTVDKLTQQLLDDVMFKADGAKKS